MTLGDQAETILREVQAGHRKLRAELRAVSGGRGRAGDDAAAGSKGSASPFEDLDVPTWAGPKEGRRR
jgi:hypothetical protein